MDKKKSISQVERLTKIGIALSSEKDINAFFNLVLDEAIHYTNSDGGTIYIVSDDGKYLDFKIVCTKSMNVKLGIADTKKWPSIPLYDDGKKNLNHFASFVAHKGISKSIDDVYHQTIYDNSGTIRYDKANNYRTKSIVAVPMKNHENDVLGVIQLINAMDEKGEKISYSKEHITMLTSLASQAAIAMTNKKLIEGLENLLHQFIKSIAKAIDRKSQYTGGHISRVANLTEMIAREIQTDNQIFKNKTFTEDELQEISIAGWMHDFGKITTPICIMDKATKLQTIFDRIELVITRFEMIASMMECEMRTSDDMRKKEIEQQLEELQDDLKFVQEMNKGGEFLENEYKQRIDRIFEFGYDFEGKTYHLIDEDEKKNLEIRKGTLSKEEFDKMREHAEVTHEMLSELTFPKKYKNVPKFASAHHEKLNGKGYPFGLTEGQLPLQAKIIAVSDLFEALTAADRPYKSGKALSETFKIMAFMASDNEIDKNVLDLLIDSEIYRSYAEKYLNPEQIDEVDFEKIRKIYHKK